MKSGEFILTERENVYPKHFRTIWVGNCFLRILCEKNLRNPQADFYLTSKISFSNSGCG